MLPIMIQLSQTQNAQPHVPFTPGHLNGTHVMMRSYRPSLLDLRFTGDPWIEADDDGTAALCLDGYQLTRIRLVTLDLPSLNRVFHQLRQARRSAGNSP
jgi:hypothetical protein